jgi:hypothetical protein
MSCSTTLFRRPVRVLQRGFKSALECAIDKNGCDINVILSDGTFASHSLLLASVSPMLRDALQQISFLQEDVATIILPDFARENFAHLAKYLYGGLDGPAEDCGETELIECLRIGQWTTRAPAEDETNPLPKAVKNEPRERREREVQEEEDKDEGGWVDLINEEADDEEDQRISVKERPKRSRRKRRKYSSDEEENVKPKRGKRAAVRKANEDSTTGAVRMNQCGGCGNVCEDVSSLKDHLAACAEDGGELTSICDDDSCSARVFHSYAKFRLHRMRHENKYSCELCSNKTFREVTKYQVEICQMYYILF